LSRTALQAATALAGAGAVLMLLGVLGTTANLIGLAVVVLMTVVTAPLARGADNGWWTLMFAGAVLAGAGALLALATESVGGLVTLIGGVAVLAAAAFGFPSR
jgi:hypothetical protein